MTAPNRILALALVLAGCSTLSVESDYDPQTEFAALHTWAWLHDGAPEGVDDLTDQRVRRAVEATLPTRGLRRVAQGETADVRVAYHASVSQQIEALPAPVSIGYGWRSGYGELQTAEITTYDEGTLILDLVSQDGQMLLWRGTATQALSDDPTPEERQERIRKAVEAVLARYPPKS